MTKRHNNFNCLRAVEFRAETRASDGADDGSTLFGYAAVFNAETEINSWEGTFTERIAPGAFKKTLREKTPIMQFDHGYDARTGSVPIGRFTDIHEDSKGLYVEGELFDNPVVEPIRQAIEGQAIDGMSFRFQVVRDEWRDKDGKKIKPDELWELLWSPGERGPLQRTIKEVKLSEAGPVVFPAYEQTSVGVRFDAPEDMAALPEEERRKIVAESYIRRMPDAPEDTEAVTTLIESGMSTTDIEEIVSEDTSEDATIEEAPEDAVRSNTSEGHKKERVIPARRIVKRTIPVRTQRKDRVPMKTIEEMRARLDEIVERMNDIADEYRDGDELRDFSDDHDAEFGTLETEHNELTEKIRKAESRLKFLGKRAAEQPKSVIDGGTPALHVKRTGEDLHSVDRVRMSNMGDMESFVGGCRDNAKRIVEGLRIPGIKRSSQDDVRESILDLIDTRDSKEADLSRRVMVTTDPTYRKAFGKAVMALTTDVLSAEERAALVVGVDANGGLMVPVDLDPTIVYTDEVPINPIRELARKVTISGKSWKGLTADGVSVSRAAEAEEVGEDAPEFGDREITPTRVQGFIRYSMEMDQDWPAVEREMRVLLARAKDREEIASFTTGSGTGLIPQGLLTGATSVINTAGPLAASHIYALETALAPRYAANAKWLAHKAFYNAVRQFPAADGHDLWERIGAGQPSELIGYPTYQVENMTTDLTTAGSKMAVFGDIAEAYLIVDRIGMQVELIPHLMGPNRRPTGERGIYVMWRNTAKVLEPNAVRVLVKTAAV